MLRLRPENGPLQPNRSKRSWREKIAAPGAFDVQAAAGMPFHEALASLERHLIEQALKASHGNRADATQAGNPPASAL